MGEQQRRINKISQAAVLGVSSASNTTHLENLITERWFDNKDNYKLKMKIRKKDRARLGRLLDSARLSQ